MGIQSTDLPSEQDYQAALDELQALNDIADALCEASHDLVIATEALAEALAETASEVLQPDGN